MTISLVSDPSIVLFFPNYSIIIHCILMTTAADIDPLCNRVEWKITNISQKLKDYAKGQCMWSPEFTAFGIRGMQLEFFANGYDTVKMDGFCSLFFWCPVGTRVSYQLFVGSYTRAPDEDFFDTRNGHGHTNFCPIHAEIDEADDSVTVGVEILDVQKEIALGGGLKIIRPWMHKLLAPMLSVIGNRSMSRCEWHVKQVSKRVRQFPTGASLFSPVFSLLGIRDIQMEFYPNGNVNTTKEGFCAFYIRCPIGTQIQVMLSIGNIRRGPIPAKFESQAGKGLPDFCELRPQIDPGADQVIITMEVQLVHPKGEESQSFASDTLVI